VELKIMMGTIDPHFKENGDIAVANLLAGRPWDHGRIPPTYTPDPIYGELMIVKVPDDVC
jgi:hypothetical protein